MYSVKPGTTYRSFSAPRAHPGHQLQMQQHGCCSGQLPPHGVCALCCRQQPGLLQPLPHRATALEVVGNCGVELVGEGDQGVTAQTSQGVPHPPQHLVATLDLSSAQLPQRHPHHVQLKPLQKQRGAQCQDLQPNCTQSQHKLCMGVLMVHRALYKNIVSQQIGCSQSRSPCDHRMQRFSAKLQIQHVQPSPQMQRLLLD